MLIQLKTKQKKIDSKLINFHEAQLVIVNREYKQSEKFVCNLPIYGKTIGSKKPVSLKTLRYLKCHSPHYFWSLTS